MTQVESAARVQFEIAVKEASNCRHERIEVSCFSCKKRNDCDIQDRINQAKNLLTILLIAIIFASCNRAGAGAIEITDSMVHWSANQFSIMPEMNDTITYIIQGSIDDNTIVLMNTDDSTYISMIVESAYIEQYLSGVQISLIKLP